MSSGSRTYRSPSLRTPAVATISSLLSSIYKNRKLNVNEELENYENLPQEDPKTDPIDCRNYSTINIHRFQNLLSIYFVYLQLVFQLTDFL